MSKMRDVFETLNNNEILRKHAEGVQDESVRSALLYMLDINRPEIDEYGQSSLTFDYFDGQKSLDEIIRLKQGEDALAIFSEQMNELKNISHQQLTQLTMKMNFAYAVTLMETCQTDMLKHAVISQPEFMSIALEKIPDFQSVKVNLLDININPDFITGFVIKLLTEFLYHKIPHVITIYRCTLGSDYPEFIKDKIGELVKIADIRHDIVHRNGYDKEGNVHNLNVEMVSKAQ